MAQAVTVYRWDDAGAPQLDLVSPSRIITILKKCLVDGYGSKSPLGWTLAYEDASTFKVAFRNSPVLGSGGYVQFWSTNGSDSPVTMYAKVSQSMAALDDFFNPGYIGLINPANTFKRWIIIGTSTGFYFLLHHETSNYGVGSNNFERSYFFGDFISTVTNDVATMIGVAHNERSVSSVFVVASTAQNNSPLGAFALCASSTNANTINSSTVLVPVSPAGSAVPSDLVLFIPGFSAVSLSGAGSLGTAVYFSRVLLKLNGLIATSNDMGDDVTKPFFRGYLPGGFGTTSAYHNQLFPFLKTINGRTCYMTSCTSASASFGGGYFFIDTFEWEDLNRD